MANLFGLRHFGNEAGNEAGTSDERLMHASLDAAGYRVPMEWALREIEIELDTQQLRVLPEELFSSEALSAGFDRRTENESPIDIRLSRLLEALVRMSWPQAPADRQ